MCAELVVCRQQQSWKRLGRNALGLFQFSGGGKHAGTSVSRCHVWHVMSCAAPCFQKFHTLKYYQNVDSDTDNDTSKGSSDNWILTYRPICWLSDTWLHTESVAHLLSFGHATQHAVKKRQQKNENMIFTAKHCIIVCFAYNACCEIILL